MGSVARVSCRAEDVLAAGCSSFPLQSFFLVKDTRAAITTGLPLDLTGGQEFHRRQFGGTRCGGLRVALNHRVCRANIGELGVAYYLVEREY